MRKKILLLVFVLAVLLRVTNLYTLPRWDWDEGVNMNIAWNLVQGKAQMFCISYPFFPHPPLFFMILGSMLWVFGNSLMVLRALVVVYGLCTTVLLYFLGKELFDSRVGLLASFLYAVYPAAIYWGRQGFANNQLAFFSVLGFYFLVRFLNAKRQRYLYLAALSVSLCAVTELTGFAFVVSFWIVLWMYSRKDFWKGFFVSLVLPAVYFLVVVFFMREAFFYDAGHYGMGGTMQGPSAMVVVGLLLLTIYLIKPLRDVYTGIARSVDLDLPVYYAIASLTVFLPLTESRFLVSIDYFWLGVLGFSLLEKKKRNLTLCFFLAYFLLVVSMDRSDHMLIPLYPYFALGLGVFLPLLYKRALGYFPGLLKRFKKEVSPAVILLLVAYPVVFMSLQSVTLFVLGGIQSEPVNSDLAVVDYLNQHTTPQDFVIVPSHLPRFLHAKTGILTQGVAIEGVPIKYESGDIPKERFLFNCSYRNAKYVIVANSTLNELKITPELKKIAEDIQSWNLINANADIWENPKQSSR